MSAFHDKGFDGSTLLKLAVFKGYIRKWLPVFLTQYGGRRKNFQKVNIYDFFAGPGYDTDGNRGSPVIITEEIKQYCQTNPALKASDVAVRMVFNDLDSLNIDQLQKTIQVQQQI